MQKSGIYKITNTLNGKVYIGKSVDLSQRWFSHKSYLKSGKHFNKHLQRAWNKYGEKSLVFEIVEYCDESEVEQREIFWIKDYNSFKNGYNLTLGGEGCTGRIVTEIHRERLRESNLGKQSRCGWKHSDITKHKISQKHKGKKLTCEQKSVLLESRKGKSLTEDHKRRISEYRTGKRFTEEQKSEMSKLHQGESNGSSKLKDEDVREIKLLIKSSQILLKDIAKMFNISRQTISMINKNKIWKHVQV